MTTVTFTLPDELVEQAKAAGILTDEVIIEFIEEELERKKHVREFFDIVKRLRAVQPPITQEEIDAELEAFYAEQYGTPKKESADTP